MSDVVYWIGTEKKNSRVPELLMCLPSKQTIPSKRKCQVTMIETQISQKKKNVIVLNCAGRNELTRLNWLTELNRCCVC